MRIRLANIDDGPRLWALRLEMLADAPLAYIETLDRAVAGGLGDYRRRVGTWTTEPDRALFVAEEGDEPVGQVAGFEHAGRTALVMVYLTPRHRGRGTLGALVDAVARWSGAAGRRELTLAVMADNARARRAYAKLGFVESGVRFPHPELPVFTELEMVRPA